MLQTENSLYDLIEFHHLMIKEVKTKKTLRRELEDEINQFLKSGGEIKHIDKGISGKEIGANLNGKNITFDSSGQQTRTPLTDEIKALDERKNKKPEKPSEKKPTKKIIYDDFGEPLREIWE